jgi:hypothetical protein
MTSKQRNADTQWAVKDIALRNRIAELKGQPV